jgi:hypothetical protein
MAHVLPSEGDVGRWNNAARKIESLRISGDVDVTSSPSQMTVVVRPRTQQQSAAQQARPASSGYWFELTGTYNASTGYPWKRLIADGTGTDFTDASPADTGSYLFDPNGNESRTSGERVFVRPHGTVSGNPSYMIVAGAGGGAADGFFAVLVKWNAGSDGNNTTYATWTYDLYATSDTGYVTPLNLSGALQPENSPARIAKWSVTKATDGTVGEAYYDAAGVIQLYTCREKIAGQINCST